MKSSRIISFFLILTLIAPTSLYAADTENDYNAAKVKVLNVQATDPSLPNTVTDQKGSIGFIISKLFDSDGKIGNWFLKALGTRSDGAILRWTGGNGGQFVQGSIYDSGTSVGIGTSSVPEQFNIVGGTPRISLRDNTGGVTTQDNWLIGTNIVTDGGTVNWGDFGIWNQEDNTGFVIENTTGNIGLGTTAPTSRLQLGDNTANSDNYITFGERVEAAEGNLPFIGQTSITGTELSVGLGARSSGGGVGFFAGGSSSFFNNSTLRMFISPAGNVGIGTSSISTGLKLDVEGKVGATEYCDNNGGNCFSSSSVALSGSTVGGGGTSNYLPKFIDATTLGNSNIQDSGTNVSIGSGLEVTGTIKSGELSATNGITMLESRYTTADAPNTLGAHYGDGATVLGYAVRPKTGGSGYVSSAGNVAWGKSALTMTRDFVFSNAAPAISTVGSDVTLTERFRINSAGNVSIGNSSGVSNSLNLYGSTAGKYSRLFTSNGNLHVDAGLGAGGGDGMYLNYYNGSTVYIGGATSPSSLVVNQDVSAANVSTNCVGNCPSSVSPPASGNWSLTGDLDITGDIIATDLDLSGDITAANFYDEAPSTNVALKTGIYNSTHTTWATAGRIASTTVTVPSGEIRKYRVSAKTMFYPTDGLGYGLIRILCNGAALDNQYEYGQAVGWESIDLEGYIALGAGTHTCYLETYGGASNAAYTSTYHHSPAYTKILMWPLQG